MTERQNIDFGIFNFDIYHSYMVYLIISTYYNKMQVNFYFDYDAFYFHRIENIKRTKLFHLQTIFYQLPYTGTDLRLIYISWFMWLKSFLHTSLINIKGWGMVFSLSMHINVNSCFLDIALTTSKVFYLHNICLATLVLIHFVFKIKYYCIQFLSFTQFFKLNVSQNFPQFKYFVIVCEFILIL